MDFGIYPPEINSGRMYTGPGSGPMLAAAQAWGSLADELYTAASAYQSVVSELTSGSWSGPSSASMTARGRVLCGMAERHRCTGRRDRHPSPGGGRRLRGGVCDDGAAAGDRRQPQPAGGAGGDELPGDEHTGDRGHRGAVRRDVGPGRRRDVRLRGFVGSRDRAEPVHLTTAEHRSGRHGQPGSCGQPGHQHLRRQRAERCFFDSASVLRGAQRADERLNVGTVDFPLGLAGPVERLDHNIWRCAGSSEYHSGRWVGAPGNSRSSVRDWRHSYGLQPG